jgi:hypothetical protein
MDRKSRPVVVEDEPEILGKDLKAFLAETVGKPLRLLALHRGPPPEAIFVSRGRSDLMRLRMVPVDDSTLRARFAWGPPNRRKYRTFLVSGHPTWKFDPPEPFPDGVNLESLLRPF